MAKPLDIGELGNPDGYVLSVHPGWSLYVPPTEAEKAHALRKVPVGAVAVPHIFETYVRSDDGEFMVVLMFLADPETNTIRLAAGLSPQAHTDDALARIFDARPREWWIRHAYLNLALFDEDEATDDNLPRWRPGTDAAEEVQPVRQRRRMSNAFLSEVAEVYRQAFLAGDNPTRAVASHYDKPYSTAGRWVGEARSRNVLEPASFFERSDIPSTGD
ncbi:hypothetical protein [Leifsonia sp. 22587]|uniref:hypothetical protein n=1 Tax=Leifsonia sp. 22587 TaxID=3453946 RepID=UPI003F8513AD